MRFAIDIMNTSQFGGEAKCLGFGLNFSISWFWKSKPAVDKTLGLGSKPAAKEEPVKRSK